MGVWFFEETRPWAFSLADEMTALEVTLILRGALDDDEQPAVAALSELSAQVIDLAAVRAARRLG